MTTNHLFTRKPIPPGRKSVLETCIHCGAKSWRYKSNARTYPEKRACTGPARDPLEIQQLSEKIAKMEGRLEKLKGKLAQIQNNQNQ